MTLPKNWEHRHLELREDLIALAEHRFRLRRDLGLYVVGRPPAVVTSRASSQERPTMTLAELFARVIREDPWPWRALCENIRRVIEAPREFARRLSEVIESEFEAEIALPGEMATKRLRHAAKQAANRRREIGERDDG